MQWTLLERSIVLLGDLGMLSPKEITAGPSGGQSVRLLPVDHLNHPRSSGHTVSAPSGRSGKGGRGKQDLQTEKDSGNTHTLLGL